MIDIDKLEALAKAATPGPWISYTPKGVALNPFEATFIAGPPLRYMNRSQGFCPADGNYIAALEPTAILELITEVRRMRALLDHRPALNAGLVEAYTQWTTGVYESDGSAMGKETQQ